jgi:NADH-quinone oxidoreductase subunit M
MTLLLGIYPSLVTDITGPSVASLVADYQAAIPVAPATQFALQ